MRRARVAILAVCGSVAFMAMPALAVQAKTSKVIDACALVTPAEAGAALGGTYGDGSTPKSVKRWKPDKVTRGYGECLLPLAKTSEKGAVLDLVVWRYLTPAAATGAFARLVKQDQKVGWKVVEVHGVGDRAAFWPAQADPTQPSGSGITSPMFYAVAGKHLVRLADSRGDHTSPDGRKPVTDQSAESPALANLATPILNRLATGG
jgi:hypothetical protein